MVGKHERASDGEPTPQKLAKILKRATEGEYQPKHAKPDKSKGNGKAGKQ
jgi:hypothetical protein